MNPLLSIECGPNYKRKLCTFSFLFSISFILNGYASGISGVSLGSAMFIILIAWAFLTNKRGIQLLSARITTCIISLVLLSSFSFFLTPIHSYSDFLLGFLKIITWLLMITIVASRFYKNSTFQRWFFRIAILLTIYIFIQSILFYTFHFYLPNIYDFLFFKPYDAEYANYELLGGGSILRAGSLLSESSFYGTYMLCAIVLFFESNFQKMTFKKWFILLFFSLGIILSTSTSAMVYLLFIWIVYIFRIKKKFVVFVILIFLLLFIGLLLLTGSISFDSGFFSSIKYAFEKFTYIGDSTRVGKSFGYLSILNTYQLLFGVGLGNDVFYVKQCLGLDKVYLNSLTSLIFQAGIIGLVLFSFLILFLFKKCYERKDIPGMILLLVYFSSGISSGVYFSTYGILLMFVVTGRLYSSKFKKERGIEQWVTC